MSKQGEIEVEDIRRKFPFFRNSDQIYLDNASTTQKPDKVLEAVEQYLSKASNIGRGEYSLAFQNSEKVESSREQIAELIGADKKEIIFTSGATESLNMVAEVWAENNLEDGDEILVSSEDHKSAKLPWYSLKQRLAEKGIGINIKEYRLRTDRQPNYAGIKQKTSENTRLISLTHIHNSYGSLTDAKKVKDIIPDETLISLDACQSISHRPIDVKDLEADFLSFSGHKMFADTGIGVLFIDKSLHESISPRRKGGGKKDKVPYNLEPGTSNISGIISLGAAAEFIKQTNVKSIQKRLHKLNRILYEELQDIEDIQLLSPSNAEGPVSFKTNKLSSAEIGLYLDQENIFVRTGDHCSSNQETVRVSPHFYNTEKELRELINNLKQII